jgi:COMPASS component SWD1
MVTEKSPLPAVIITPSSPTSITDFSIAYLPPPTKPSACERLCFVIAPFQAKARTIILLLLLFSVVLCHVITHRLATRHPQLDFSVHNDARSNHHLSTIFDWLDIKSLLGVVVEEKREFVVTAAASA